MKNKFPVCEYCGVAFTVGLKECDNKWCNKPVKYTIEPISEITDSQVKTHTLKKKYEAKRQRQTLERWRSIVSRSKKKNIICDITEQDIIELLQSKCVYCGSTTRIEVDRKDSTKGYIKTNIAPACRRCNTIKNNVVTYEEMMTIVDILGWRIE